MSGPEPEQIEPDTKDWTWVLQRPCPECGTTSRTICTTSVADGSDVCGTPERRAFHPRRAHLSSTPLCVEPLLRGPACGRSC